MNTQSSVGQQVEAQAVAGAMTGERAYHEIRFPATGDFETELINMVNIFCGNHIRGAYESQHLNERVASIFDYLAKRYRDSAGEMQRQLESLRVPTQKPWEDIERQMGQIRAAEAAKAKAQVERLMNTPAQANKTATEVLSISEKEAQWRQEMREAMLSEMNKTTIR